MTPNHLCSDYFLSFFFQLKRSCFRCEEMNKKKKRPHEKEGNMVNNVNRKTLWQTYLIIKRGQKMTTNEEKCKRDKKLCSRKLNVCLVLTNRNLLTSYLKEKESGRMKKKNVSHRNLIKAKTTIYATHKHTMRITIWYPSLLQRWRTICGNWCGRAIEIVARIHLLAPVNSQLGTRLLCRPHSRNT